MQFLAPINLKGNEIQNARIQNLATAPASPVEGQLYHNTVDHFTYIYDGSDWQNLMGSSTVPALTGDVTTDGLTNETTIANGVIVDAMIAADAAIALSKLATDPLARANHTGTQSADTLVDGTTNKAFLATERTKLAGIAAGATVNLPDATLLARANHTGTQTAATISDFDAAVRLSRLDQLAVPTAALDLNGQLISGLADPVSAQDAATRAYVLAQVSALVDSAPGVLDTLNELAAALGDDPNFATTLAGQIADGLDRANHTGTQDVSTVIGAMKRYAVTIGDGSTTSFVVTHNLNSQDVIVQVYEVDSPYNQIMVDIKATTVNTATIAFASAPASGAYRVVIIG